MQKSLKSLAIIALLAISYGCSGDSYTDTWGDGQQTYSRRQTSPCSESGIARLLGRLYYLANPINVKTNPDSLIAFIQEYRQYLTQDGQLIQCANRLGTSLGYQGLKSFSEYDYNQAYESAMNLGANMDQATSVATSMTSATVDAYMMGKELLWLADVIPHAASGNWAPFTNTGTETRKSIRQIWPMYQTMIAIDPSMGSIMENVMEQLQPWVEYQVAVLAYWMG